MNDAASAGEFKFRWNTEESERFKELVINGNKGEYYEILKARSSALCNVKNKIWKEIKISMVKEFPRLEKMSIFQMKNHLKCLQRKYVDDAMTIPRGDPNLPRSTDEGSILLKEKYATYIDNNDSFQDSETADADDFEMVESKFIPDSEGARIQLDEVICLNVGGTKFFTSWQTLTKEPNSELAKLCDPEAVLSQRIVFKDSAYFIDRDCERFRLVLEYLRDGELKRGISEDVLLGLLIEADHFQLAKLKSEINFRLQEMCAVICINVGGTRFETTRETLKREPESVLAKIFDPDTSESPLLIKDGSLFLDRNPDVFKVILDYLRLGELCASVVHNEALIWSLKKEAEFLKLPELNEMLEKISFIKIEVNGTMYKELKATVIKNSESLLTRIVNENCENSLADLDGSKPMLLNISEPENFKLLWQKRLLRITKITPLCTTNRFHSLTEIARALTLLDEDEKLSY